LIAYSPPSRQISTFFVASSAATSTTVGGLTRDIWTQLNHTGKTAAERDESGGVGDRVAVASRSGSVQEEAAARVEMDRILRFRVLNETSSSTNPLTGVMPNHLV
jgi:hypothetical protein